MASTSLPASIVAMPSASREIPTGAVSPGKATSPSSMGRLPRNSHHSASAARSTSARRDSNRRRSQRTIQIPHASRVRTSCRFENAKCSRSHPNTRATPWAYCPHPRWSAAMKGHPEVVDYLNFLLRGELAARDQYFLHSRRYEDLGLHALYQRINHEMEEETQHADALLRRILFLEGKPDMRPDAFEPGETVEQMLRKDL